MMTAPAPITTPAQSLEVRGDTIGQVIVKRDEGPGMVFVLSHDDYTTSLSAPSGDVVCSWHSTVLSVNPVVLAAARGAAAVYLNSRSPRSAESLACARAAAQAAAFEHIAAVKASAARSA